MDAKELIKYRMTSLAGKIPYIKDHFILRIAKLEKHELLELIKFKPSPIFTSQAITLFSQSGSFDSAYSRGINIIVPHGVYLADSELELLFEEIYKNNSYGINQILNAGGIDEVFSKLYTNTKENVVKHKNIWKGFWDKVSENYIFADLQELLLHDSVIEEEVIEETDSDDDIPF